MEAEIVKVPFIRLFLYYIKGFYREAALLVMLAIIIGCIETFNISLIYPMISTGFRIEQDSLPFSQFFTIFNSVIPIGSPFVNYGIVFIIFTTVAFFLQLYYFRSAYRFTSAIITKIKMDIFSTVERNDYRFFVQKKQGDILFLFNAGPNTVSSTIETVINITADLALTVSILILLFMISSFGLLLIMVVGLLFYWVLHLIGVKISEHLGRLAVLSGQSEYKVVNEYVNGSKMITASNTVRFWKNLYVTAVRLYWDRYADAKFIERIPILAINSLFYIAVGAIVLILYIYYADNFMVVIPTLGTFAVGAFKILPRFTNFGNYKLGLKNQYPTLNTLYQFLNDDTYLSMRPGTEEFHGLFGDIVLEDVSFAYHQKDVLSHLTITIEKNKVTALVGASGSGKSTLTTLLLRLYDPREGTVLVNGKDLKEYDIGTFRNLTGYVSQDSFIFNASIRDNITFGKDYTDEEVRWSAERAHADLFIENLPDRYDTIVGDQGVRLSGGEKQRIAIARAIIRKPDLLILDEATSSLDNISETLVQKAIDKVALQCTSVIIAHRLSTIRHADRIYVIQKGEVVETGTHETLMEMHGVYYAMQMAAERQDEHTSYPSMNHEEVSL